MIEEYHFGSIVINGKTYDFDVEVYWTGEVLKWWREKGHVFGVEDVKRAVKKNPEVIVLGTGFYGICEVTEECKNYIEGRKIELIIEKTENAVKIFNDLLKESKKVVGLFHLTC
jgi:hypothetical protein